MKKYILAAVIIISFGFIPDALASRELVQIISFEWDTETKNLKPISISSGTIIDEDFILTAKHVVTKENGDPADFSLICMGGLSKDFTVKCDIQAKVIAVHPKYDAALIRPLEKKIYMPTIRRRDQMLMPGNTVRVMHFPLSQQKILEYGANTTFDNILYWIHKGGELATGEEKEVVLRGQTKSIGKMEDNGAVYYLTDVKTEVESFGGAAFDSSYNYLGIPTKRDSKLNAMILSFNQLEEWVDEQIDLDIRPEIPTEIINYYLTKVRFPKILANRKKQVQKSVREKNVLTNIFKVKSLKEEFTRRPAKTWRKITPSDRVKKARWSPNLIKSRKRRTQNTRKNNYYLRTTER